MRAPTLLPLLLVLLFAACDGESSLPLPAPSAVSAAGPTASLDRLLADVRVRGVVERAHRHGARWGGEVTLLRLAEGAGSLRLLVEAPPPMEDGTTVTLRGVLASLDMRELGFFAGLELGEDTDSLPVVLRLMEASLAEDDPRYQPIDSTSTLVRELPPLALTGSLRTDPFRVQLSGGQCLRVLVPAEDQDRWRGHRGRVVTTEGALQPWLDSPPSPEDDCWTIPGVALHRPRIRPVR